MITLSGTPTLATERLALRAPQASDWPAWFDFAMTDRSRFIGGAFPENLAWRAFCHVIGTWVARGYGQFVFTLKGRDSALGLAGPWHPIDWPEPEIGWTVWSPAAEGKSYAFEAAVAARAYAYDTLRWTTAVSYIHPGNARSIALGLRLGGVLRPDLPGSEPGDVVILHDLRGLV